MTALTTEWVSESNALEDTERRRMDGLLATLGHEMRNPLSALSYALEIWPGGEADATRMGELRDIMRRQVNQLVRLSDDLLDVARIAQGKLQLRREPVVLTHLIEQACEQIRPLIDGSGHAMSVWLPAEPIVVDGDVSKLIQVFSNLIQNAAKFTDNNGSLSVTVGSQDKMAVVRVRDNGRGIESHLLPVIFDSYTQGARPIGPKGDGLGIGLGLVKAIVELHGGSVAAHSEGPGQGSEFTVQLPQSSEATHGSPDGMLSGVAGHDARRPPIFRVVVIDDDRSNRELLARLLRMNGQSVTVASDGTMGVRMVLAERPHVVFLDLMMQDMDGCEVANRLRSNPELAGLILIALSGSGDEGSRVRARAAGFDKYLVKPASAAMLTAALIAVSRQPPSPA